MSVASPKICATSHPKCGLTLGFLFLSLHFLLSTWLAYDLAISALAASIKWSQSTVSSSWIKYGSGPGFAPCTTLPLKRSLSVVCGTNCSYVALFIDTVPFLTASIDKTIEISLHCFHLIGQFGFAGSFAGADLDHFLLFPTCKREDSTSHHLAMCTFWSDHNGESATF